jgi:hypothetical protein
MMGAEALIRGVQLMLAEEALFEGHPVAHVVAFYERQRTGRAELVDRRGQRARRPILGLNFCG